VGALRRARTRTARRRLQRETTAGIHRRNAGLGELAAEARLAESAAERPETPSASRDVRSSAWEEVGCGREVWVPGMRRYRHQEKRLTGVVRPAPCRFCLDCFTSRTSEDLCHHPSRCAAPSQPASPFAREPATYRALQHSSSSRSRGCLRYLADGIADSWSTAHAGSFPALVHRADPARRNICLAQQIATATKQGSLLPKQTSAARQLAARSG
jgi:hypothetical protein